MFRTSNENSEYIGIPSAKEEIKGFRTIFSDFPDSKLNFAKPGKASAKSAPLSGNFGKRTPASHWLEVLTV